jgi:hypothetical protein
MLTDQPMEKTYNVLAYLKHSIHDVQLRSAPESQKQVVSGIPLTFWWMNLSHQQLISSFVGCFWHTGYDMKTPLYKFVQW